jgi:DNA mismatch repair protein MutS
VEGAADRSYGIHVARLAGVPRAVLERAKTILANLEAQALDIRGRPSIAPDPGPGPDPASPAGVPGSGAVGARGRRPRNEGPVQLDLFRDANAEVLKELKRLKVEEMTPLEALNYLAKLRDEIV